MKIGENILKLRKEKRLSQEELGEMVGVTRQTISNWELNETIPDTNQLIALSKALNISIDDLVNNDIKNVLIEKTSNTEKLAGMIITIIKVIGFLVLGFIVFMIVICTLFMVIRKERSTTENKLVTLNCSIEDKNYEITIGDGNYYVCDNCTKEMNVFIKDITDWANLEHSVQNINKYFAENGGICDNK